MSNNQVENLEFIKTAGKTKRGGHNRFQVEIVQLNTTIDDLKDSIKIKDDELELFKKNFVSLQLQNTNNNNNTAKLTDCLDKLTNENATLLKKIENINNMNVYLISNLEKEKQVLLNEKDDNLKQISCNMSENKSLLFRYNDIKVKYQNSLIALQQKTDTLSNVESVNTITKTELNLLKELNLTHTKEMDNIKKELIIAYSDISSLKIDLFEKDNELKNLNRNIANSKPQFKAFKTNTHLNENTDEKVVDISTAKHTSKLATKPLKRGIKATRK